VMLTHRDQSASARGLAQRKTAFGRVPLPLAWDKMGHTGQIRDTLRSHVTNGDTRRWSPNVVWTRTVVVTEGSEQR
jgi:ribosomal protein L28